MPIRSFRVVPFIAGLRIVAFVILGWLLTGLAGPALGGQSTAADPARDEGLPASDGSRVPSAPT